MSKTINYNGQPLHLKISNYRSAPMTTLLSIIDNQQQSKSITICLGETIGWDDPLPKGCAWIDEIKNPGITETLKNAHLITPWIQKGSKDPYSFKGSDGFYTLYQVDLNEMNKYDPEGTQIYNASYDTGYKIFQIEHMDEDEYREYEERKCEEEAQKYRAEEDDLKAREIPYEDPDAPENKEWDMMHKYF